MRAHVGCEWGWFYFGVERNVRLGHVEEFDEAVLDEGGWNCFSGGGWFLEVVGVGGLVILFSSFPRGIVEVGALGQGFLAWPSPMSLLFKFTVVSIVSSVCDGGDFCSGDSSCVIILWCLVGLTCRFFCCRCFFCWFCCCRVTRCVFRCCFVYSFDVYFLFGILESIGFLDWAGFYCFSLMVETMSSVVFCCFSFGAFWGRAFALWRSFLKFQQGGRLPSTTTIIFLSRQSMISGGLSGFLPWLNWVGWLYGTVWRWAW